MRGVSMMVTAAARDWLVAMDSLCREDETMSSSCIAQNSSGCNACPTHLCGVDVHCKVSAIAHQVGIADVVLGHTYRAGRGREMQAREVQQALQRA